MINSGIMEKEEFESIINSKKVSIVDFSATWCGPCRMMVPIVEDLSEKYKGKYYFYSIDIDSSEELSIENKISVVPTFVVFKDGKELGRTSGYMELEELDSFITNLVK